VNVSAPITRERHQRLVDRAPLNAEEIFRQGFRVEQDLGPEVYRDVMQASNTLINSTPSGIFLSRREFKVRAACLAWLAGVFEGKSLDEVLKGLN